jgi:hypothetical protein
MSKVVRLNEQDLIRLVNKVVNEQQKTSGDLHPIPKNHPIYNPLWIEMTNNVEGEGVETIKYIPKKMLVIDAFGNKYTITKG